VRTQVRTAHRALMEQALRGGPSPSRVPRLPFHPMAIPEFIARWQDSGASERANYQLFLSELCDELGVPRPEPSKPEEAANRYVFEKAVTFLHGDGSTSHGRIDLYKRGCFVLEAKQGTISDAPVERLGHGRRQSAGWDEAMMKARGQAESYARALPTAEGWPPFLIVVDVGFSIEVYADFSRSGKTYTPFPDASCHRLFLPDLGKTEIVEWLRAIWTDPISLDPSRRTARVTREVADTLATLARSLEGSGFAPKEIFDFLMRAIFTMFAEDVGLLPGGGFTRLLEEMEGDAAIFQEMLESLWGTMNQGGFSPILKAKLLRFNGGLFEQSRALPLTKPQIHILAQAARFDWRDVEPAIFGTLVERALDPKERHKLGAHYTPRAYVERLVLPTIIEPLRAEWDAVKAEALTLKGKRGKARTKGGAEVSPAVACLLDFLRHLSTVKVLDPACGSGNFLYVTLEHMKRLEAEVQEALAAFGYVQTGLEFEDFAVTPVQFLGLEINPRAAAIADLVLWIGYLQWHLRTHGGAHPKEPVIERFHSIENRDALIDHDGTEPVLDEAGKPLTRWDGVTFKTHSVTGDQVPDETATVPVVRYLNPRKTTWPKADFIVGNPPFIGAKRMRAVLGDAYVDAIQFAWKDVPQSTDFVMRWWHIAAEIVRNNQAQKFGFITTNTLNQAYVRRVVEHHLSEGSNLKIRFAIPDHPWVDSTDGAAVRISMTVCDTNPDPNGHLLEVIKETETGRDAVEVSLRERIGEIHPDLRIGAKINEIAPLSSNDALCSVGMKTIGSGFQISLDKARSLGYPCNFDGRQLIRPYLNGRDLLQESREIFVIDLFGMTEAQVQDAAPDIYQHLLDTVKPERLQNRNAIFARDWWIIGHPRQVFRKATMGISRYIATVETAKHQIFSFLKTSIAPDSTIVTFALSDAFHLGVLSSRVHVAWSLAAGGRLGVGNDPRYNKTKCFDPFPFPACSPEAMDKIRQLGERLDAHRKRQQEQHPGLTMTGMYNVLEALREGRALTAKEKVIHEEGLVSLLREIHDDLDRAVFAAYGWPATLSDEEILERLVALNAERAQEEAAGQVRWLRPEFQCPTAAVPVPVQEDLALPDAAPKKARKAKAPAKGKAVKVPWPETAREQIQALRTALAFSGGTLTSEELAERFQGAKAEAVGILLGAMEALGQIREQEGRFAA